MAGDKEKNSIRSESNRMDILLALLGGLTFLNIYLSHIHNTSHKIETAPRLNKPTVATIGAIDDSPESYDNKNVTVQGYITQLGVNTYKESNGTFKLAEYLLRDGTNKQEVPLMVYSFNVESTFSGHVQVTGEFTADEPQPDMSGMSIIPAYTDTDVSIHPIGK